MSTGLTHHLWYIVLIDTWEAFSSLKKEENYEEWLPIDTLN